MQAEGEEQEPWLGTITWETSSRHQRRSGPGVLIAPNIVCTTASLLYDAESRTCIDKGTFRLAGRHGAREVDIVDYYIPRWYRQYESAGSMLSRYHDFAFVKLAQKVPAPSLAMVNGTGLTSGSKLTLLSPALERIPLEVTAPGLAYMRADVKVHGLVSCPQLVCRTEAETDPAGLAVLYDGYLVGLAIDRTRYERQPDNRPVFGVDILLCTPYLQWERQNAERRFEKFGTALADEQRRTELEQACGKQLTYWKFVRLARKVYGDRFQWPGEVQDKAKELAGTMAIAIPRRWHELPDYAIDLEGRLARQPPHSMLEHLCQRIGDAQLGARFPVRVRVMTPDGIRYVEVSAANFDRVYAAAEAMAWNHSADEGWKRLELLSRPQVKMKSSKEESETSEKGWTVFPQSEASRSWIETWQSMLTIPPDMEARRDRFNDDVKDAGEWITGWVEPEVLELIEWPEIRVHAGLSPEFEGDDRAHYTTKTRTIHIKESAFDPGQLLHEFGHHLEDQGPVEVWCGLVSYLTAGSEGRPLDKPGDHNRTPVYWWITKGDPHGYGENPPMPTHRYALSYNVGGDTELIAVALQNFLPSWPHRNVRWTADAQGFDPVYLWHILRAIRPKQCLEYGITVPALLDAAWFTEVYGQ